MIDIYFDPDTARTLAFSAAGQGNIVVLYNKARPVIQWLARLLGHEHEVHHTSLLYLHPKLNVVVERELTDGGQTMLPVYNDSFLHDTVGSMVLPKWWGTGPTHHKEICTDFTSNLTITWRSLLRSGVEHTLPPWSAFLARAILRVFGDDPTPMTCSGYVYHLLTGNTNPHSLLLPPHLLYFILQYEDVLPRHERAAQRPPYDIEGNL
jgi:hypothetical protein